MGPLALPANQRAEVFIGDSGKDNWKPAGIGYLAGSNTCVFSGPAHELDTAQHIVQTSNRRFGDDEFLIPHTIAFGRSTIPVP